MNVRDDMRKAYLFDKNPDNVVRMLDAKMKNDNLIEKEINRDLNSKTMQEIVPFKSEG